MASLAENLIEQGFERGIKQGIEQGIGQGKLETAREMLKENSDLMYIAKVTKLSLCQIKALQI